MIAHIHRFHQEEHGRGNHGNRNDPERDGDAITGVEEAMIVHHCTKEKAHEALQAQTKCFAEKTCMKALDYISDMTTKLVYKRQFAPETKQVSVQV